MRKTLKQLSPKKLYRNHIMRVAVLASLAAGLAYLTASFIPWVDAPVAAIIALIAIKPTFHASMKESFEQIVGTVLGAIFGIILVSLLGFNIFTLIIMIFTAFLLSWWMKLGESGALTIGITLVLVTGPIAALGAIEARLAAVVLGSLFAIAASYFILPGKPDERVVDASMSLSRQTSNILKDIAIRMSERENKITFDEAYRWTERVERLIVEVGKVKQDAEDTVVGAKWSPLIQRKEAEKALEHITETENIIFIVYNIANDITVAIEQDNRLPDNVAVNISSMLLQASEGLQEKAENKGYNILDTAAVEKFKSKKEKAIDSIKNIDNTQAITLGGSLIQDATKLKKTLTK